MRLPSISRSKCRMARIPLAVGRGSSLPRMIRRKTMPPELQSAYAAFEAQAVRVESARRALLSCLPVGRVDPAPIPVGLDLLRDELTAVLGDMEAWRVPPVERQWRASRAAIKEALTGIPEVHRVASSSRELEELLGAVGE